MVYKRGESYWYEFIFAGKRFRESAKTSRKTIAKEAEKNRKKELEMTLAGMPIEQIIRVYPTHREHRYTLMYKRAIMSMSFHP